MKKNIIYILSIIGMAIAFGLLVLLPTCNNNDRPDMQSIEEVNINHGEIK